MNSDQSKAIILVNLDANNQKADEKWKSIKDDVERIIPLRTKIIEYNIPFNIKQCLEEEILENKVNFIISAGGDGSANIILNEIMRFPKDEVSDLKLGFIGLGSSNDLLKPYDGMIGEIPVKINPSSSIKSDIGIATFFNEKDEIQKRYFLANSSIGVGASANWFFNKGDFLMRFLKTRWINLAVTYATVKTILGFRNYPVEIEYLDKKRDLMVSHLSIIKNPNISGNLKFDQEIAPNDGNLGLNICENMNKRQLIGVMKDLQNGVFSGKPNRHSAYVKDLWIRSKNLIPVEFDGEIELIREIKYGIIPKYLGILQ